MNRLFQRLSEVELQHLQLLRRQVQRRSSGQRQDARIAAFENAGSEETQKKISAQQAELEKKIAEELEAQKEELEKQLAHMDRIYEESHSAIARQLLAKIVAQ